MPPRRSLKPMVDPKAPQRPPRYPNETTLETRTEEKDKAALHLATLAYAALDKRCRKAREDEKGAFHEDLETMVAEQPHAFGEVPEVRLPLESMYEGTGDWPRRNDPVRGARQPSASNIGFPDDETLVVKVFEEDISIETEEASVASLARDIFDIKTKTAQDIADTGEVESHREYGRVIETFKLHGRTIAKVTLKEADVYKSPYSNLRVSKELEQRINREMGDQPTLVVEQWVAAHLLLSRAGQIGGRTQDYWKRARDLAQQQLYLDPLLEKKALDKIAAGCPEDPSFRRMIDMVKKCILRKTFNPYTQAQRDEWAVSHGLLYHIKDTEIVMVLDKAGRVVVFQCSDAFRKLLTKGIEKQVSSAIDTFSTLQPVPVPDMTRHGLHWIDWLLVKRPDLDYRNPKNDPRVAKSGVFHFGGRCRAGDPSGTKTPAWTRDSKQNIDSWPHAARQLTKLRYSAFGACTEIARFFFELLEPELLAEYQDVAREIGKLGDVPFETRRDNNDPFVLRALLINLMTYDHKDTGDWRFGLAGLVCLGEFDGGDLVLRELGFRIEARPGCVQLLRGHELRHSITEWTGKRFVVVNTMHEAVRRWALREMGEDSVRAGTTTADTCQEINLEDVYPEDQVIEDERDRIPERHLEDSSSDRDSSASE